MNNNISAIIRMLLSGFGAFLLGKNLFGHAIDASLWQEIVGAVMVLISVVWSIMDKTSGYEKTEGFIRQFLTTIGGLALSLGIVKEETWQTISGVIGILLPYILSLLGKKKSQSVAIGDTPLKALTGVKEIAKTETISPIVNIPKK